MHVIATTKRARAASGTPAGPLGARVVLRPHRRRPSPNLRRVGSCIALFEACSAFYGLFPVMRCTRPIPLWNRGQAAFPQRITVADQVAIVGVSFSKEIRQCSDSTICSSEPKDLSKGTNRQRLDHPTKRGQALNCIERDRGQAAFPQRITVADQVAIVGVSFSKEIRQCSDSTICSSEPKDLSKGTNRQRLDHPTKRGQALNCIERDEKPVLHSAIGGNEIFVDFLGIPHA